MKATIGDRVRIHGKTVGAAERLGDVIDVHEHDDVQTLVVRFDDGHEAVLAPGTDCEIVSAK